MKNALNFELTGGNKNAKFNNLQYQKDDIVFFKINLKLQNEVPESFVVKFETSATDTCSVWSSFDRVHTIRPDWGKTEIHSRLASGMPIQQLISFEDNNKMCVSVSDVDTPIKISMGYCEETAQVVCEVEFFTLPTNKRSEYNATIRVDFRKIKFYDSIYDTVEWWETEHGYKSAFVPEYAKLPMDSLWYSFHQNLDYCKILEECKKSKELGLETVIIDDGWQTGDNNRGYAYCGDWSVCENKMSDMALLVKNIHKIGMKVILWYSVPFMGIYSKKYNEFKDVLLDDSGDNSTFFALDPRYKKVRDYLASLYEKAVIDWQLDGLKLDFIDSFVLKGKSLVPDESRDYESLEEAIHNLLSETKERLTKLNKDILIEFRQSYVGPSIRKYGNMLRVGDCPGDVLTNRSQIVNLRLTSGKTAVHSDMIMWNVNDTVENAAQQFVNVLYAVPQVSMLINNLPAEHIDMLKFYLNFWKEHKGILLNGKLTAENPENEYSCVRATIDNNEIITSYTNCLVEVLKNTSIIVNGTKSNMVVIKGAKGYKGKVLNCLGEKISTIEINDDLIEVDVPRAGQIYLNK